MHAPDVTTLFGLAAAPAAGSFVGTLVVRLPRTEPVVAARSQCPICRATLRPVELVPLVSYLAQNGACRHCGARISTFYPSVELAAIAIALTSLGLVPAPHFLPACLLGWTLLALAWTDAEHFVLPDAVNAFLLVSGLAVTALFDLDDLLPHAAAAACGAAVLWGVAALYQAVRKRPGLGLGDVKMAAGIGAWVGPWDLPTVVLLASVAGLVVLLIGALSGRAVRADTRIPFGAFLAGATWVVWLVSASAHGAA